MNNPTLQPDPNGRWEPTDEPTILERIIASMYRRGQPVPLTATEQQRLSTMSLEQRCDYIAKIIVWTARATLRHIRETEKGAPKQDTPK